MRSAAALLIANTPRYVSPKERVENGARWLRPDAWLTARGDRGVDASLGFPVLCMIKAIAAR